MIGIRASSRFKTTDSKKSLGVVFQKMNQDAKQLFGDLVETNKVRKKRLKIAKKSRDDEWEKENKYLSRLKSEIKPATTAKGQSSLAVNLIYIYIYTVITGTHAGGGA